jgi:hypothetical protein
MSAGPRRQAAARTCSSSWSGRFAPTMQDVTAGLASVQAIASSTRLWPWSRAKV